MIRLNCFFKPNTVDSFQTALAAAVNLTEKSQKHEGNITYDIFKSATCSDKFMICETWENQEVLNKHSAIPEFTENVAIIQGCGKLKLESFKF